MGDTKFSGVTQGEKRHKPKKDGVSNTFGATKGAKNTFTDDGIHYTQALQDELAGEAERWMWRGRRAGLHVVLKAIEGLTDPDMLPYPYYFQCPPLEQFATSHTFNFVDTDTVSFGQITQPSGRGLKTITFDTLLVLTDASWVTLPGSHNPVARAQQLIDLCDSGTPFELLIGQSKVWHRLDVHWGPKNDNAATLRQLEVSEKAGEPDARYLNVQFTEYRSPQLHRAGKGRGRGGHGNRKPWIIYINEKGGFREPQGTRHLSRKYTQQLRKHDPLSLYDVSAVFYGKRSEWKRIVRANDKVPGIKKWAPSRSLGALVKAHAKKQKEIKLTIPAPPVKTRDVFVVTGTTPGSIAAGDINDGAVPTVTAE